jgi:Family of unknown function (DUF5719)
VRRLFANKLVIGTLVVLALGAQYGLAWLSHPVAAAAGRQPQSASRALVTAAIRACPSPGSLAGGAVALAAAAPAAPSGAGTAAVTRLSAAGSTGAGQPLFTRTRPGVLTRTRIPVATPRSGRVPAGSQSAGDGKIPSGPARGGVMVRATGPMARALEVEQTGAGGLPTASCDGPGTDFWFVGPGQHALAGLQLYLMNADGQPADAEVDIFTDSGPLLGSTDTGIAVPAHGLVVQSLSKLLRGTRVVALHVRTSVGRIVAALRETKSVRQTGAWLPASQPPARSIVLPGLPSSAGSRDLYVAVPGAGNAQVKLTAVTAKGSYRPTGGNGIDLPGGSAALVALPSLGGVAAAIKLTSNVPVAAAIRVSGGPAGAAGVFSAASAPVQEQGAVADNLSGSGKTSALVLSAPRGAARVRITEEGTTAAQPPSAGGQPARVVEVAAKHTTVVRLRTPSGSAARSPFAVLITPLPGSGPVYAGRVLTVGGTVESIFPVLSSLTSVPLAPVRDSLGAALP